MKPGIPPHQSGPSKDPWGAPALREAPQLILGGILATKK